MWHHAAQPPDWGNWESQWAEPKQVRPASQAGLTVGLLTVPTAAPGWFVQNSCKCGRVEFHRIYHVNTPSLDPTWEEKPFSLALVSLWLNNSSCSIFHYALSRRQNQCVAIEMPKTQHMWCLLAIFQLKIHKENKTLLLHNTCAWQTREAALFRLRGRRQIAVLCVGSELPKFCLPLTKHRGVCVFAQQISQKKKLWWGHGWQRCTLTVSSELSVTWHYWKLSDNACGKPGRSLTTGQEFLCGVTW